VLRPGAIRDGRNSTLRPRAVGDRGNSALRTGAIGDRGNSASIRQGNIGYCDCNDGDHK
jgi:hypothetical protein